MKLWTLITTLKFLLFNFNAKIGIEIGRLNNYEIVKYYFESRRHSTFILNHSTINDLQLFSYCMTFHWNSIICISIPIKSIMLITDMILIFLYLMKLNKTIWWCWSKRIIWRFYIYPLRFPSLVITLATLVFSIACYGKCWTNHRAKKIFGPRTEFNPN